MPRSKSARPRRRSSNSSSSRPYGRSVFINCPFDQQYEPLFQATIFTVFDCGYVPRCALEVAGSEKVRIDKIIGLIKRCRLGIHDLSRTDADPTSGLPRFNMPLELGLFLGAQRFGSRSQRQKICLVLEKAPYDYQKFISDIAGQDIKAHGADVGELIRVIRNWLTTVTKDRPLPGGSAIGQRFAKFREDLPDLCKRLQWTVSELTFTDYSAAVAIWLREQMAEAETSLPGKRRKARKR